MHQNGVAFPSWDLLFKFPPRVLFVCCRVFKCAPPPPPRGTEGPGDSAPPPALVLPHPASHRLDRLPADGTVIPTDADDLARRLLRPASPRVNPRLRTSSHGSVSKTHHRIHILNVSDTEYICIHTKNL